MGPMGTASLIYESTRVFGETDVSSEPTTHGVVAWGSEIPAPCPTHPDCPPLLSARVLSWNTFEAGHDRRGERVEDWSQSIHAITSYRCRSAVDVALWYSPTGTGVARYGL